MNKTLKILLIIIGSILILFTGFWIISKPIRADKTRKQDILNFLNGKSFNNISKETIKIYKEINKVEKEENFDISDLILDYTTKIKKSLVYKKQHPLEVDFNVNSKIKNSSNEAIIKTYLSSDCSIFLERFSKEDIDIAGTEKFNSYLFEELEQIFTHKGKLYATGWFIDKDCLKNAKQINENTYEFKLPYEVYITYTKRNVQLKENNFINVSLNKISDNNYNIILTDSNNKEYTTYLTFDHKNSWFHKRDMTINIYGINALYSPTTIALFTEEKRQLRINENVEIKTEEAGGLIFEQNLYY